MQAILSTNRSNESDAMKNSVRIRTSFYFLLLVGVFIFSSCGPESPQTTTEANDSSGESGYPSAYPGPGGSTRLNLTSTRTVEISTPQSDFTTVTGVVISQRTNRPIVEVPVQLAGVYYEGERGAFVLDTAKSPTTTTDGEGRFVFVDIVPQDYVIVIGNVEVNDYVILPEETGRAKIWTAVASQILETGTHNVLLENWE